ncbi:MAG TPA: neutral zinc metallopeptidase [Edaphobacter sp.]|jgi:predicted metalloprotease|nr:neutral zinc metallopeptidase [Edaphobacter sp.]
MDWTPGGLSRDVEDRRGSSGGGFGGGGIGIIGLLFLLVISLVTGRNYIGSYLSGGGHVATTNTRPATSSAAEDRSAQLVSFTLDDVQQTWEKLLPEQARQDYRHARLVLFRDYTRSGCGAAQSQTGPFYCPADEKVYMDLSFWDELRRLGGGTAEFAQAYVVAHELGHHVQNILGIDQQMRQLQQQNPRARNQLSVMLELQADCLAGVWGHSAAQRGIIHQDDVDAGLRAAAAVGDDHIQKMSRGAVSPESFTHGTSEQRQSWFMKGLQSGDIRSCNTFQSQSNGGSF